MLKADTMAALRAVDVAWTNAFNQLFAVADFTLKPGSTAANAELVRQTLHNLTTLHEHKSAHLVLGKWNSAVLAKFPLAPPPVEEEESEGEAPVEEEEEDDEEEEVVQALGAAVDAVDLHAA
jgi:hypothetical protein